MPPNTRRITNTKTMIRHVEGLTKQFKYGIDFDLPGDIAEMELTKRQLINEANRQLPPGSFFEIRIARKDLDPWFREAKTTNEAIRSKAYWVATFLNDMTQPSYEDDDCYDGDLWNPWVNEFSKHGIVMMGRTKQQQGEPCES